MNAKAPLSGKKIALVGCGTIGGYLARALVQLGAGFGSDFLLIDEQILTPENLGRHALGVRYLNKAKAEGVESWLREDFPDASVSSHVTEASRAFDRLAGYDLIIDATGDQQFSDSLNAFALEKKRTESLFPPILYTMIFGNGLAVQSYMSTLANSAACYKCLKPRFDGNWRYNPILPKFSETAAVVRPCSQGAFIPFAVSASLSCASLAAQHVVSFFETNYTNDLRTVRIDYEKTRDIEFRNVDQSKACPACS